jgi:hypothetical protein
MMRSIKLTNKINNILMIIKHCKMNMIYNKYKNLIK